MIRHPPCPFPQVGRFRLQAGSELHRIHDRAYPCEGFNPGKGRPTRFAPLVRADGTFVATAYCAATLECAVHETIFHEIQHDAPRKTIRFSALEPLAYARLTLTREITLAALFEPDLNAWGIRRSELIDTHACDYLATAKWALAIHDAHPEIAGLIWTSRRCDPATAYLLFGDRLHPQDLLALEQRDVTSDDTLLLDIRNFGARAGITISL